MAEIITSLAKETSESPAEPTDTPVEAQPAPPAVTQEEDCRSSPVTAVDAVCPFMSCLRAGMRLAGDTFPLIALRLQPQRDSAMHRKETACIGMGANADAHEKRLGLPPTGQENERWYAVCDRTVRRWGYLCLVHACFAAMVTVCRVRV
jgi:hypothetical protein